MDMDMDIDILQAEQTLKHMIDVLLTEVRVPRKLNEAFQGWLGKFQKLLLSLEPENDVNISDRLKSLKLPLPKNIDAKSICSQLQWKWKKPEDVRVVGSWSYNTAVVNVSHVDLLLEIPKECLHKSDMLNHKYHVKRALYLAILAKKLKNKCEELTYICPDGNPLKPVLEIHVQQEFYVRLHGVPPEDFFKSSRALPDKNNLRLNSFFKDVDCSEAEACSVGTPHYNYSVAVDVFMRSHEALVQNYLGSHKSFVDAILLLKVWLQQRSLNEGYGSFSNFMLTMFICYLVDKNEIDSTMSSYQILRIALHKLSTSEWDKKGLTFLNEEDNLNLWHQHSEVVFVDPSGFLNLTHQLSKYTYFRTKCEARQSLIKLNEANLQSFKSVFMKKVSFLKTFDHVVQFIDTSKLEESVASQEHQRWSILDHSGYVYPVAVKLVGSLIEKCLGKRIECIDVELPKICRWKTNHLPSYEVGSKIPVRFGLIVNREAAFKLVEKCESEDLAVVKDFKEFWGDLSQLRRFRDGSMFEAVVFNSDKKRVCYEMLKSSCIVHLNLDLSLSVTSYLDVQLETCIEPTFCKKEYEANLINASRKRKKVPKIKTNPEIVSVDEITVKASSAFDKLTKLLRDLKDLPLTITSVQGISPILRATNPFPTPPQMFISSGLFIQRNPQYRHIAALKSPKRKGGKGGKGVQLIEKVPKHVEPICVVVQMESTGKWPDDLEAILHLKCALLIRIGQLLRSQFGFTTHPYLHYLDVLMDGFVLRIRLVYMKELILLRQTKEADGLLKLKDNTDSLEMEKDAVHLPKLTSTLHSFQLQFEPFGKICRLAKRWLASHLMLTYSSRASFNDYVDAASAFTEESVELLVASLFTNCSPYLYPPNEVQTGFLRFLNMLANTDWESVPVIVNFNQSLTVSEIQNIEREFSKRRQTLPALFIATPYDKTHHSVWTKHIQKIIIKRVALLAETALKHLTVQLTTEFGVFEELKNSVTKIFASSLDHFDVIIRLKKQMNSRSYQNIHAHPAAKLEFKEYKKSGDEFIPIVDFDPVRLYLKDLRESYDHLALFFNDIYGGDCIAVVWKPEVFKPKEFSLSNCKGRKFDDQNEKLELNVGAILESFETMGTGLVDQVEAKTENWKI